MVLGNIWNKLFDKKKRIGSSGGRFLKIRIFFFSFIALIFNENVSDTGVMITSIN